MICDLDSSPRMWGYLFFLMIPITKNRFIPTDVGLPNDGVLTRAQHSIHPHGCGATDCLVFIRHNETDSSPRMWGYRSQHNKYYSPRRFIPTDVGLPTSHVQYKENTPIHPHGCGATPLNIHQSPYYSDSSPRMWGYLLVKIITRKLVRFIPTDVGLPRCNKTRMQTITIHPHGCGATLQFDQNRVRHFDSSPRMWGYRCGVRQAPHTARFIPTDVGLPC